MTEHTTRPSGEPPYWAPGTEIWWRYRSPRWTPGAPEWVNPMTVVQDDADSLVAWMPVGTPVTFVRRADGRDLRADPGTMFTAPRRMVASTWKHYDILRVSLTARPWSVWLFWKPDGTFDGYYVNLEAVHARDDRSVYTSDRVLDLDVGPDGTCRRKDEDELVLAVEQGVYTEAEATELTAHLEAVEQVVDAWGPPFCDGWESFRPDPGWPVQSLPPDVVTAGS